MAHMIVGVDIAKNVMQVHWVDPESGHRRSTSRVRGARVWAS